MTDLAPSSSLDIRAEISAAYSAWDSAFNKADAKAVASAYVPNAKVLPPTHEVISGPAAIENFFAGLFSSGAKGKGADGAPQTAAGLATHVFERQVDGSLKLRLHTFN